MKVGHGGGTMRARVWRTPTALVLVGFVAVACCVGCRKGAVVEEILVGKILTVAEIPTSWNTSSRTQITCERYACVIRGIHSFPLGIEGRICVYENGSRWFSWKGGNRQYLVQ